MLYKRSVFMVILGGVCLSLLGIGMRLMDGASGPQIVFYRSIAQAIFFLVLLKFTGNRTIVATMRAVNRRAWLVAILIAAAEFFMVMALLYTSVANAVFIVSLAPVASAILGWVFLKEHVSRHTLIAIVIAIIGVSIIFGFNMNGKGLIGMGLAFLMMMLYSGSIVVVRTIPDANMFALLAISGCILTIVMLPIVGDFEVTAKDLILCLGLGVIQVGMGLFLIFTGARYVPAAQVSLLALLEVVLSPLWVWIFVNEVPSVFTLIGGAIVLAGVIFLVLEKKPKVQLL